MPIPDAVLPDEPEADDQRKLNERYRAVNDACNALLHRQLTCSKLCGVNCPEKCKELQEWLDVGGDE